MPNYLHSYKNKDKARSTRNAQRARYYKKTQLYTGKRRWTYEEDKAVLEHGVSDTELSYAIKRSVQSIQARRHRLKYQKNNRE